MKMVRQCTQLRFPIATFFLLILLPINSATDAGIRYSAHCGGIVRDQPLLPDPNPPILDPSFLSLRNAHVDISSRHTNTGHRSLIPSSLSLSSRRAFRTRRDAVFKVEAVLKLYGVEYFFNSKHRGLRLVHFRRPRIPVSSDDAWNSQRFSLSGFWDSTSGKLCMVGSVDTFGFPTNRAPNIEDLRQGLCTYIRLAGRVELEYTSDCSNVNCNFLGSGSGNFVPNEMYLTEIECRQDGMVRFLLGFGDSGRNVYHSPFLPNVTLVSVGKWDHMVGCGIFSDSDEGLVGECLIRLSLRFPALWTLRTRSSVIGEMWSSRSVNESGYFGKVMLSSVKNNNVRTADLRYDYKEIENAKSVCSNKSKKVEGENYPYASSSDMRFDMVVENRKFKDIWGYASPVYVDDRHYQFSTMFRSESDSTWRVKQNLSDVVNVSYVLHIANSRDFKLSSEFMQVKSFEISAEGTYDDKNGHLCMVGCLQIESPRIIGKNSSLDCEILVDIWYSPLNSRNGGTVKGTIVSRREKSDHLYFEPFEISSLSIYAGQAKESLWKMDLETTMVLISNTMFCIFMGLQLLHVKKHPDKLPFISVIMLIVLALAHTFPLLLNFQAPFNRSHNNLSVYFGNDGWLVVNEVLVRVITMLAFLLELRLLHYIISAKSCRQVQGFKL